MSPAGNQSLHAVARSRAVEIVRTLRDAKHTAYLAGGCVRDELLGLVPTDYDVATDAEPGVITSLFERTSEVGAAFGVVLVHHGPGRVTEVATFRKDFAYEDKRRPSRVEFTTAEHDAERRDFTVNALFLDPLDDAGEPVPEVDGREGGTVIDYVGGRADLEAGVIRAVGVPDDRLAEDHLRALRAVRFACRLGFDLDPATANAIRAHAAELAGVSRERIGEEIRKMLAHPARARAAGLLQSLGLDRPSLLEDHREAEPAVLGRLDRDAGFPLALAAWAIDRHGSVNGGSGGGDRDSHDLADLGAAELGEIAKAASRWRSALCLSNDERDAVDRMLETLGILRGIWKDAEVSHQKRVVAAPSFSDAMALLRILDPGGAASVEARIDELAGIGMGLRPRPLLDGDALIALGLQPGPSFTRILTGVYDAQLDGRVADLAGAERLARELAGGNGV